MVEKLNNHHVLGSGEYAWDGKFVAKLVEAYGWENLRRELNRIDLWFESFPAIYLVREIGLARMAKAGMGEKELEPLHELLGIHYPNFAEMAKDISALVDNETITRYWETIKLHCEWPSQALEYNNFRQFVFKWMQRSSKNLVFQK